jgi:hypothetical protein
MDLFFTLLSRSDHSQLESMDGGKRGARQEAYKILKSCVRRDGDKIPEISWIYQQRCFVYTESSEERQEIDSRVGLPKLFT